MSLLSNIVKHNPKNQKQTKTQHNPPKPKSNPWAILMKKTNDEPK